MTAPNRSIPKDSYGLGAGTSGLNSMSRMTEDSVKQAIRAPVVGSFSKAKSNWLGKLAADISGAISGISQAFNFAFLGKGEKPPPSFDEVVKTAINMKAAVEDEINTSLSRIDELGVEIRGKIEEQGGLIENLQLLQQELPKVQKLAQQGIDDAKRAVESGESSVSQVNEVLQGKLDLANEEIQKVLLKATQANSAAAKANAWVNENQQKLIETHTAMFDEQGKFNKAQSEVNQRLEETDREIESVLQAEQRTRTRVAFGEGTNLDKGIRVEGYFTLTREDAFLDGITDSSAIGSLGSPGTSVGDISKRALRLYREGEGQWSGWVLIQAKTNNDATDMFHARIEKSTPNGAVEGGRYVTGGTDRAGFIGLGLSYQKVFVQVFPD